MPSRTHESPRTMSRTQQHLLLHKRWGQGPQMVWGSLSRAASAAWLRLLGRPASRPGRLPAPSSLAALAWPARILPWPATRSQQPCCACVAGPHHAGAIMMSTLCSRVRVLTGPGESVRAIAAHRNLRHHTAQIRGPKTPRLPHIWPPHCSGNQGHWAGQSSCW